MAKQYYGGQAVMEGVMMRGRKAMAVAVRNPQGKVVLHEEPLTARIYTANWGQWPFSCVGRRCCGMPWVWGSAHCCGVVRSRRRKGAKGRVFGSRCLDDCRRQPTLLIALLSPTFAARLLAGWLGSMPIVHAIFEGVIRLLLFLVYLWLIGRFLKIKRVVIMVRNTRPSMPMKQANN